MRLLNTTTLRVENVAPGGVPDYAILSHRWLDDEVSFQDISTDAGRRKAGFAKVQTCCALALSEGLSHVWIDTCCIDKTSSAELSEAINSMFKWYRDARVCYAYIYDATGAADLLRSDWFNRGWTLQELIAPRHVVFYAGDWSPCGDRATLSPVLSAKTGISAGFLHGQQDLAYASIAERMSWAATRQTTREEDMAYCLLGLFDIQMPLIYGEGGERAFQRLQRRLIEEISDQSWLAWSVCLNSGPASGTQPSGSVMASSPAYFRDCRDIVPCHRDSPRAPVTVTNIGVHLSLPVIQKGETEYIMLLDCRWRHDYTNFISVPLSLHSGCYYRTSAATTVCPESRWPPSQGQITLSTRPLHTPPDLLKDLYHFMDIPQGLEIVEVEPAEAWEPSPAHIRIRKDTVSGCFPPRYVRLRASDPAEEDSSTTKDYILRLKPLMGRGDNTFKHGYLVGILPRACPLTEANHHVRTWGKAVLVPALEGALSVSIVTKRVFDRDTHVVQLYFDKSDVGFGPVKTWATQVLTQTPAALLASHQEAERERARESERVEEERYEWRHRQVMKAKALKVQRKEEIRYQNRRQREDDEARRVKMEAILIGVGAVSLVLGIILGIGCGVWIAGSEECTIKGDKDRPGNCPSAKQSSSLGSPLVGRVSKPL